MDRKGRVIAGHFTAEVETAGTDGVSLGEQFMAVAGFPSQGGVTPDPRIRPEIRSAAQKAATEEVLQLASEEGEFIFPVFRVSTYELVKQPPLKRLRYLTPWGWLLIVSVVGVTLMNVLYFLGIVH